MKILVAFASLIALVIRSSASPPEDPNSILSGEKFTTEEHIEGYGYPVKVHFVTTADGYILKVFQIPYGVKCGKDRPRKKPVILWHGLMSNSIDFLLNGAEDSLGFMLADDCHEVWLPNARGNFQSRNHTTLSPTQSKFWAFSWHEIGIYDLPAVINYVLEKTKATKIYYVGHSQGTTAFFVWAAMNPNDAAEKVEKMVALAPIAFMGNAANPGLRVLAQGIGPAQPFIDMLGPREFQPSNALLKLMGRTVCQANIDGQYGICDNALFMFVGLGYKDFNSKLMPNITVHDPAGASAWQISHYVQEAKSGFFRQMDFGYKNIRKYGSSQPPSYEIQKIRTPMHLFYSGSDWMSSDVDVFHFHDLTKNSSTLRSCGDLDHMSFLFAINVATIINEPILEIFNS